MGKKFYRTERLKIPKLQRQLEGSGQNLFLLVTLLFLCPVHIFNVWIYFKMEMDDVTMTEAPSLPLASLKRPLEDSEKTLPEPKRFKTDNESAFSSSVSLLLIFLLFFI